MWYVTLTFIRVINGVTCICNYSTHGWSAVIPPTQPSQSAPEDCDDVLHLGLGGGGTRGL